MIALTCKFSADNSPSILWSKFSPRNMKSNYNLKGKNIAEWEKGLEWEELEFEKKLISQGL